MKKLLTKIEYNLYHIKDGMRIKGVHSELYGDISELSGDVSGLYGYVSGLSGYVSDCEITDEDRAKGIDISELIKE